jgi:hypothetical protein
MITGISASDRIYDILNVSAVTSLLDGQIYKEEPLDEEIYQKRNITIFPLSTTNDNTNEHVVNINVFTPNLLSGQADELTLKTITETVIATLKAYVQDTDYCHIDVVGNQLIKDERNRSYMNVRVELITE